MRNIITITATVMVALTLAACGSNGSGSSATTGGPGKSGKPTPATQSKEGVEAAERALVKAYDTKRYHDAYLLQSNRCRKITDFETYQGQILMAFGFLPEDLDWTIESVKIHEINADKTVAKAEVVIPDLVAAMGSSGEGDRWIYEEREDGAKSWGLDDCDQAEGGGSEGTTRNIPEASEADVAKHIVKETGGIYENGTVTLASYDTGDFYCESSVIMVDAGSVAMYADAGDPVATDPSGTVGVKISSNDQPKCAEAFRSALVSWGE